MFTLTSLMPSQQNRPVQQTVNCLFVVCLFISLFFCLFVCLFKGKGNCPDSTLISLTIKVFTANMS